MDWIKKHYDQFALALLALALLVLSVMLILRAQGFGSTFAAAAATAIPHDKVPPVPLERIDEANKTLEHPPQWAEVDSHDEGSSAPKKRGSLFVSDLYVIGKDGMPSKPGKESFYNDTLTGKPIPNPWIMNNRLPLLDQTVPFQDPDKDGFNNEDEWRGLDASAPGTKPTDPNNKDSHPPYYSKLFIRQFIKVPFRLLFNAYNGEPKRDKPEAFEFQINTIDLRQPSEFLKIGEKVSRTNFQLKKFEIKSQLNAKTEEQEDVSELTLYNAETDVTVVLVLNRVTDSPDYFIKFVYKWPNPPIEFTVKKLGEFVLKPNVTEKYKLVDSGEEKALIQLPDGTKVEILRDPRDRK